MKLNTFAAGFASAMLVAVGSSHALSVSIDQFTITRNGSIVLNDDFGDGDPPPSGPTALQPTYFVSGTIAAGAESGGRLALDGDDGFSTANALGTPRLEVNAVRITSITGQPSALSSSDLLTESGRFDLTIPQGPLFSAYGIRFSDNLRNATPPHQGQNLQLFVRFNDTNAQAEIAYILQDFVAGSIALLGSTPLLAALPSGGADQIEFTLAQSNAGSSFSGSYQFFKNGVDTGTGGTLGSGSLFGDPNFPYVRGLFFVAQAVPEPATFALLGIGLAGLGFARRQNRALARVG